MEQLTKKTSIFIQKVRLTFQSSSNLLKRWKVWILLYNVFEVPYWHVLAIVDISIKRPSTSINFHHAYRYFGHLGEEGVTQVFTIFFSPWRKLEDRFDVEINDLPVLVPTQKKPFIRTILKNSYKVLPIISKSFILNVTGFLDLPLMIERIYLTLCCDLCCSIVKEMVL